MANHQQDQTTRLGLFGLIPFVAAAVALWLSPWLLPQYVALDFHRVALIYGGLVVIYHSGFGAGLQLSPNAPSNGSLLPGIFLRTAAFFAILPDGTLGYSLGAAWRHMIILALLIFVLMRCFGAVAAGALPGWYGALRLRLTFWAAIAIVLIMSRLLLWGFY